MELEVPKYVINTIKQVAQAQGWTRPHCDLGGMPAEAADGKHQGCFKCGGTDRFRVFSDYAETGGMICNQCGKFSDGIAALQWMTSEDFKTTIQKLADYLGVKPIADKSGDLDKDLEFLDWSSALVPYFTARRMEGIPAEQVEAALLAMGARRAKYKGSIAVYAIPVIGSGLNVDKPDGWIVLDAMGGTVPKCDKSGKEIGTVKAKLVYGSKPGLVNLHAIERLATEGLVDTIWKVEGVTDALALWIAIPENLRDRHVVLTNANGAGEQPKWMASALARAKPHVIHDADDPGEAGAKVWSQEITRNGVDTTIVRLPYEIEPNHGKDLRDWLREGNTYDDLLELARQGDVCRAASEGSGDGEGGEESKVDFPIQELIMKRLKLEVLYEDCSGKVRVFSTHLRKSTTFDRVSRITKTDLLQACRDPASLHISSDPDGVNTWSIQDVKDAIALQAADRRGKNDDRGIGVWQGLKEDGSPKDSLILVGDTEAARWNGEKLLNRELHPRIDGLVLDFGQESEQWYDFEKLAGYVINAEESIDWRENTIQQSIELFSRWNWKGEHKPELVTGLIMATWVQTVWAWRPQVAVTGTTNSGKSTLFRTLGGENGMLGMFGGLVLASSRSSEAGIRQGIGNTGRIPLLDEFEKSNDRVNILKMIRASSRGDLVMKGTTSQRGMQFRLQHIFWVAAIESGLKEEADENRFIPLKLLVAEEGRSNKLKPPPSAVCVDLGLRLLACSIVVALKARDLAVDLKCVSIKHANSRMIENYAVPTAILASALGMDRGQTEDLLVSLMSDMAIEGQEIEETHERLFEAILDATVLCDRGQRFSVRQLLESYYVGGIAWRENAKDLERSGIAFRKDEAAQDRLVIHKASVMKYLLKDTEWAGTNIDQILEYKTGYKTGVRIKFSGAQKRCITLPLPENSPDDL